MDLLEGGENGGDRRWRRHIMRREYVDERGDGLEGKGFGDVRKGRKLMVS